MSTDPTEPTTPLNPTEPTTPLEPTTPTTPLEPTDPADATTSAEASVRPPRYEASAFAAPPAYAPPAYAPAPADTAGVSPAAYPPPRVRWAGIVWGAFFAVLATLALAVLTVTVRREAIHDWLLTLRPDSVDPGAIVGIVILAVGVLLLVAGGVAVLRRAQLRTTAGR